MTRTAVETNSVGTRNASEPEQNPHPIRGEGEPVAELKTRFDYHVEWIKRAGEIGGAGWDDGKCPLIVSSLLHLAQDAIRYAHPPTSYEGEDIKATSPLDRERALSILADHLDEAYNAGAEFAQIYSSAEQARAILQALQSASVK